jgi:hypothetical protein
MLSEHTAAALPSARGAVARTWGAASGWRHVRALWAMVGQVIGAHRAKQPDASCEPDPFATEVPFLTDRWPAGD